MDSLTLAWLARQCETLPGAKRAVVVLVAAQNATAAWPPGGGAHPDLVRLALASRSQGGPLADESAPGAQGEPGVIRLALPFPRGAVAFEVHDSKPGAGAELARRIQASIGWLEFAAQRERGLEWLLVHADLVAAALEPDSLREAARAVTTELALRLDCDRVGIGFRGRSGIELAALSHTESFDARTRVARDIAAAMDEACDQDAVVVLPQIEQRPARVVHAHAKLVSAHGAGSLCSVPFGRGGELLGAWSFERPAARPHDAHSVAQCEALAAALGSLLAGRRAAEAGPLERWREALREGARLLREPGHREWKAGAAAAAALLALALVIPLPYRVTSRATLEGLVQRVVVAGLDGYVAEANARAGDLVRKGQVLAELDPRDLVLERRKWLGRREQLRKQHREALAAHERSDVAILSAQLAQAEAQLELAEEQLRRTRLLAPFDGVIVRGDLSQALGSPVKKGEVLFEVAPLEGYRIILEVDERDIAHVRPAQPGELRLAALPGHEWALRVERVTPVATARDGRNYFRAEARVEHPAAAFRPGMEGVAKVRVARRSLAWIWTHDLLDWLRLATWSWFP